MRDLALGVLDCTSGTRKRAQGGDIKEAKLHLMISRGLGSEYDRWIRTNAVVTTMKIAATTTRKAESVAMLRTRG